MRMSPPSPAFSRTPEPRVLTTLTVPARHASTSPGTPSVESERSSSGSQNPASTRRRITCTGTQPPTVRSPTRPSRDCQVGPLDQRISELRGDRRVLERGFATANPATGSRSTGRPRPAGAAASSADRIDSMNGARRWTPVVRKSWGTPGTSPAGSRGRTPHPTAPACGARAPPSGHRPSGRGRRRTRRAAWSPGRRMPSHGPHELRDPRRSSRPAPPGAQQSAFAVEVAAGRDRAVRPAGSCRAR